MNVPRLSGKSQPLPVLLVFAWGGDKRLSIETLPPLGILSLAAFLERQGIPTDVIDLSIDPLAEVHPEKYALIGFSINIANRDVSLRKIAQIKKSHPGSHVVVGGPLCMSTPSLFTADPNIDAVFACESEEALHEYLTRTDRSSVKGIHLRTDSGSVYTGDRPWIQNVDALPFPALDKVDITRYNNYPKRNRPISSMITSRGCPFGCIFCSHSMGRKWRARSAKRVVEEIAWQVHELGVREICIYDDNFSLDRQRAEEICDLIVEQRIQISLQFANGLRADNLDHGLLAKLQRAGAWLIGLAPEVGNPEIMKRIKKGFDHQKVKAVAQSCRQLGIVTHGFFMIGFPFESRREIEETIAFAKELDCNIVEFNKVIPYPRTELYDLLIREGNLRGEPSADALSYHEGAITTHRVGDLGQEETRSLIRKAYRQYYLRPSKMVDLLRTFSIRDLFGLTIYALRTGSV